MTFPLMPQSSRGGLLLPFEGKRWMVSLGGRGDDKPLGDEAGFLDYARELCTPTIYNAIREATRIGEISRYVFPQSMRRHFELIQRWPRGLIPIGDSIFQFNPLYGQGMSVAAKEAVLLRRLLVESKGASDPLATLAPTFFAEVNTLLDTPWVMAAIPDFIFPAAVGQRQSDLQRNLKFAAALTRLAARKPDVHKLMVEVQNLVKPRRVYRRPMFMARILLEMAKGPDIRKHDQNGGSSSFGRKLTQEISAARRSTPYNAAVDRHHPVNTTYANQDDSPYRRLDRHRSRQCNPSGRRGLYRVRRCQAHRGCRGAEERLSGRPSIKTSPRSARRHPQGRTSAPHSPLSTGTAAMACTPSSIMQASTSMARSSTPTKRMRDH